MKNVNISLPKVSVIVPTYNTGRFLSRCISSIISQTYKNIEIILVDDGSTDGSAEILESFARVDGRVRVIKHGENRGLFRARLTGVSASCGEYISFVDSDDYINEDFIRCLVTRATAGGFDIVMGETVHENTEGKRWVHAGYTDILSPDRFGDEVLTDYLRQEGYCFLWHAVWNKLYTRRLFELARPFLNGIDDHLIMGEDILFSTVLHYYAKSFSKAHFAYYFYLQHPTASTALASRASKFEKSLSDLSLVFSSAERFLSGKRVSAENLEHLRRWRELYSRFWCDNIRNSALSLREKRKMLKRLEETFGVPRAERARRSDNWFYSQTIPFDVRYIELISKIKRYDTVSLDLFDTVLVRKCYKPTDLFYFVSQNHFKDSGVFHDVRVLAEREVRRGSASGEITLDEIYSHIAREHKLPEETAEKIKNAEIECEVKLLEVRESVLNLIELSRHLGKEVIITSDFYMGKGILLKILSGLGVFCDELIVSCDFGKTKSDGSLFGVLRERSASNKILHIGDNWHSDYEACRKNGIDAHFYPSVISCFMNEISDIRSTPSANVYTEPTGQWISYEHSLRFLEVRCAIALSAKRIYDNPYISYLPHSAFNCSPAFIGYYALGMHLWGVARWLYEGCLGKKNRLHFIARDGYLPRLAYEILNSEGGASSSDYIYSSRKALLPLLYLQAGCAEEILPLVRGSSRRSLDEWLSPILEGAEPNRTFEYDKPLSEPEIREYINNSLQKRLSNEKIREYVSKIKEYFSGIVSEGDSFFDIGYSGRPIMAFSSLLRASLSGFFIHRTSDEYMARQRALGVEIRCFYDYTPAITGSIREMLFSSLSPSCIGYSTEGEVRPIFEDYSLSFAEGFAIDEAQRQALLFVRDMRELYSISPELFSARPIDLSAPYEYLLSCKNVCDARYFDALGFEDDVYHGKGELSLIELWQSSQEYHRVLDMRGVGRPSFGDGLDIRVGELISGHSKPWRALFFLLFDRPLSKKKLKKNLFGDTSDKPL